MAVQHEAIDATDRIYLPARRSTSDILTGDRVRWAAVWAGLVTALTATVMFGLLGVAVGLTSITARQAQAAAPTQDAAMISGAWAAAAGVLAFLAGGFVAGRLAGVLDRSSGAWNGALVFVAAVPISLLLATGGFTALAGTLGNFASALNIDLSQVLGTAQAAATQAQDAASQAQTAEHARNAAWLTLAGLLLGLAASTAGGAAGVARQRTSE
jgi:hypothetical protein